VLLEVMELFPGEFIHIGGDEAVKNQWKASEEVQQIMRELGLETRPNCKLVHRADGRFLAEHGRRLIGWDEILEGGWPPGPS
jgi:hexosaminidase